MKPLGPLGVLIVVVGCAASGAAEDERLSLVTPPQGETVEPSSTVATAVQASAPTNWTAIRIGASKEEVKKLLGEPKSTFPSPSQLVGPVAHSLFRRDRWWPERLNMLGSIALNPATIGGSKGYHEGWEYPRDPGPVFRPSYYIYFDETGMVVRLSSPTDPDRQPLVQVAEFPLDRLIPLWEETTGVTVKYDPLLVQNVMVSIEGIEDPNMLESRVYDSCKRNGLQLSKTSTDKKPVYAITKNETGNKAIDDD